jgi:hypothetical protein
MQAPKAAGLLLAMALVVVAGPTFAAPTSGSDTVQGLYDTLLSTM